jgi:hypothetical protein
MSDAYAANVSLLLHFNGAQDSTNFLDNSLYAQAVTTNGTGKIATTQSKFGGSSLFPNSNGIYAAISPAFTFGTGDFTIEMWIWLPSSTVSKPIYSGAGSGEARTNKPNLYTGAAGNTIVYGNGSDRITSGALSYTTWYHVAVTRSGTDTKLFINGTQGGSTYTDTTDYISAAATGTYMGYYPLGSVAFPGYIDELRVTKGVARYTTDFTAPTTVFENCFLNFSDPFAGKYDPILLGQSAFQWISLTPKGVAIPVKLKGNRIDPVEWAGTGTLSGTVTEGATPLKRRLRLYDSVSGLLLYEKWSNDDGTYQFPRLSTARVFTVAVVDHTSTYNDVIAARVRPI